MTPPGELAPTVSGDAPFGDFAPADVQDRSSDVSASTLSATVEGVDAERGVLILEVGGAPLELPLDEVQELLRDEPVVSIDRSTSHMDDVGRIALGAAAIAIAPLGLSRLIARRREAAQDGPATAQPVTENR